LNLLNVFYQRLQQNIREEDHLFLQNILSIMEEIQNLHARFENNVENGIPLEIQVRNCENESNEGCMGRLRKKVSSEEVHHWFTIYQSWKEVARELGISVKTLNRRRTEFGMEISSKNGPRERLYKNNPRRFEYYCS